MINSDLVVVGPLHTICTPLQPSLYVGVLDGIQEIILPGFAPLLGSVGNTPFSTFSIFSIKIFCMIYLVFYFVFYFRSLKTNLCLLLSDLYKLLPSDAPIYGLFKWDFQCEFFNCEFVNDRLRSWGILNRAINFLYQYINTIWSLFSIYLFE